MILELVLVAVVLPASVAAAIAAAGRLLPALSRLGAHLDLLALALGYSAAHLATVGAPSIPPIDTTQGLFHLAWVAAAVGLAMAGRGGLGARLLARAVVVLSTLGLSLHPLIRYQWSAQTTALALLGLGAASFASWVAYDTLAARVSAAALRSAWIAVFGGASLLLLLGRTALLAQLAGTIAAALAAIAVASLGRRDGTASGAAALGFLVPMLHALVLNGYFYAEVSAPASIALVASPLAAALALTSAADRTRLRIVAAALGVVVLLAPFCARAASAYVADDRGYESNGYEE